MKKIYFLIGLIVLLIIGYFIFIREPKNTDLSLTPVRIGYNTESISNSVIMIAYEKGYFQKHGIDPKLLPLKGGSEVMMAFVANQIDFGSGNFTNFMKAISNGVPIKSITALVSSPQTLVVRPNENINNFSDLYGKVVAGGGSGGSGLVFQSVMAKENIDVSKMQFTEMDAGQYPLALITKKAIDAVVTMNKDAERLLSLGAIILPEWEEKGYNKQLDPRGSLFVRSEFINQQESIVDGFLNAIIDANRFIKESPMEAAELVSKHIDNGSLGAIVYSPESIAKQWGNGEMVNTIWQDPQIIVKLAKKAKELGMVDKELSLEDAYDLRFQDKLIAAQKEIYGETN